MTTPPSCPHCGEPLLALQDPGPDTPPWLSSGCRRGWWNAELTRDARAAWDPIRRAPRVSDTDTARAVAEERAARQTVRAG